MGDSQAQDPKAVPGFATEREIVCVQGLGFVGTAMSIAVAAARDESGQPRYNVIGVDLPNDAGLSKVGKLNEGIMPVETVDEELKEAFLEAHRTGNFKATTNTDAYKLASTVLVDVHLDVDYSGDEPTIAYGGFKKAIATLGENITEDCLVVVETTVPPGTCEKVVYPTLKAAFEKRGIKSKPVLAHSYERVMPGADYLKSIINFWRVFAGYDEVAGEACEKFMSTVINVKEYPLSRLHSTTASETGKVLENSYRATTIAFMEEWGRFAEEVGVDLFQVVNAIRKRPTHNNMRQPGFGVGGYCLTKDPLFAKLAAKEVFGLEGFDFPFCTAAVEANNKMPLVTLDKLREYYQGDLSGKKALLLGVSYRQDVADTRYSPSEIFVEGAKKEGMKIDYHDPLVEYWDELDCEVMHDDVPAVEGYDVVIFTVPHREYLALDLKAWLGDSDAVVVDANCVLSNDALATLKTLGKTVISIGRGN